MNPLVCFYRSNDPNDVPLFDTPSYGRAYHYLAECVTKSGARCAMAKGNFAGAGNFSAGWLFEGGDWQRTESAFHADIVYNNVSGFHGDAETNMVNHPALQEICVKDATYDLFPEFCPSSVIAHSKEDVVRMVPTLARKLIAKPLDSYGGKGIVIGDADRIAKTVTSFPCIIQEFIDTSAGIPGIAEGKHDLRVMFMGSTVVDCCVRMPAAGKELANVAQGGTLHRVPLDKVPAAALDVARNIDAKLAQFPNRVYSADLGLVNLQRWYLFELNSPPGLPNDDDPDDPKPYLRKLAEHLLQYANA